MSPDERIDFEKRLIAAAGKYGHEHSHEFERILDEFEERAHQSPGVGKKQLAVTLANEQIEQLAAQIIEGNKSDRIGGEYDYCPCCEYEGCWFSKTKDESIQAVAEVLRKAVALPVEVST